VQTSLIGTCTQDILQTSPTGWTPFIRKIAGASRANCLLTMSSGRLPDRGKYCKGAGLQGCRRETSQAVRVDTYTKKSAYAFFCIGETCTNIRC
jgi:hypothetical protein